ncbi:MAG: peptide ABC transporter substrate-binding protein, partial [Dehalococcoidia bacterium]|nr:peptide ABC transporter substrate-binding protein [Dehalococcoidia bacterium]
MLRYFMAVVGLLAVGGLTLAFAWPSPLAQQTEIVGLYENTTEGFSLVLPEGWVGEENEDNFPLLSIRGGEEDAEGDFPVRGQVWVFPRGDDSPAEVWMEGQLARFPVVSGEPRSYEGSESAHQLFTSNPTQGGGMVVDLWTAVARGSQMFLLRVQTDEADWPTFEEQANAFTDSFRLQTPMPFGASREDSLFQWWGEIVSLDPALSRQGAGGITGAIFSGLVKLDTDLQVVADMAEGWEVSGGGTIFTFTLRDNARFHDGRPVTAADFQYSWERALHPDTESPVAETYLGDIVGAEEFAAGEAPTLPGVQALDERTLRVEITDAYPYFLSKLTYPTSFVVDRANVAGGEDWTDAPNGTGAFKLEVWQKDQLLILERNEDWYGGTPELAHAVFRIFGGHPMQMYENGETDLTFVYVNDIDRAQDPANALNTQLVEGTSLCTSYLGFNLSKPPFDDPKVRQALALAMETDKQLEVTLKGLATRAGGFVPPGMLAHNDALEPSRFDAEMARQLLQESRYGGPENLPTIRSFARSDTIHWAWREHLGLEVEAVSTIEFSDFLERLDNEEFGVFTAGWCADYPDPQNFLE